MRRRRRRLRAAVVRRAARRAERGAALVEFSLVVMFILLVAFGIYEFGFAWRSSAGTTSAARGAARTASSLGVDRQADYQALSSLKADLESSGLMNSVQLVVIYKSTTTDGTVPAACTTNATTQALCNIYTPADLAGLDVSDFDTTTGCLLVATVKNYCPSGRNPVMATSDYLGVWVKVRHGYQTRLFGSGVDIRRSAVMRLEPRVG